MVYRDWKVGEQIDVYAQLTCFCGAESSTVDLERMSIVSYGEAPGFTANPNCEGFGCLSYVNKKVEFYIYNTDTREYIKKIGESYSNVQGISKITYTVTESDRQDYLDASEGYTGAYETPYCVRVLFDRITETSEGISLLEDHDMYCSVTISPAEVTEITAYYELVFSPFRFISLSILENSLNTALPAVDIFAEEYFSLTGYNYEYSEVIPNSANNTVSLRLNLSGGQNVSSLIDLPTDLPVPLSLILAMGPMMALTFTTLAAVVKVLFKKFDDVVIDPIIFQYANELLKTLGNPLLMELIKDEFGFDEVKSREIADMLIAAETAADVEAIKTKYNLTDDQIVTLIGLRSLVSKQLAAAKEETAITTGNEQLLDDLSNISTELDNNVGSCEEQYMNGTITKEEYLICINEVVEKSEEDADEIIGEPPVNGNGNGDDGDAEQFLTLLKYATIGLGGVFLLGYIQGKR